MQTRKLLLSRIETFLARHGFGRVRFSVAATGYREFVRELERGDSVTLRRIEKAEAFMAQFEATAQQSGDIAAPQSAQEPAQVEDVSVSDGERHERGCAASGGRRRREAFP
jgi:hypothetical protein